MKLTINNLKIAFDNKIVLNDFNLQIKENEFVAILGSSGCGKSTLLKILSGSLLADSGEVYVDDEVVKGISKHFAYMPQDDLLLPWMNILDNVTLYAKIHHDNKAKQQALKQFSKFGIDGYENKYPKELSGGMRQRAAFLRTSLCEADIMLLDEPFAALDIINKHQLQDWLANLRKDLHKTTLLVTHDIDEALYLADRIIVLSGSPASIVYEIDLSGINKSRDWLYEQGPLKRKIELCLK